MIQEEPPGLDLAERHGLMDSLMWGNDSPRHEGTWPHSAEAIERTVGGLTDHQRARCSGSTRRASSASRCRRRWSSRRAH